MKNVRMERKKVLARKKSDYVNVIGAGLAGCEATWQLIKRGIKVKLFEMRPKNTTPAHKTDLFAELVCSNSLRANNIGNAVGLIKEEMRICDSLIMQAAAKTSVPAGGALAVDRHLFSKYITDTLLQSELVEFVNEELIDFNNLEGPIIIASGPLTSDRLSESIKKLTGEEYLYFYDAAAPLVSYDSLDKDKIFLASRYDKGDGDYVNCPMSKDEYINFRNELINAQVAELNSFENEVFFEACMPIEEMGRRGEDTMRFGPLKPVGLVNPKTNQEAYAVVQLRQDNASATIYNIVGFQTHLKWSEQKRVFSMIPGLENAEFLRFGVMHRNTFINSPKLLDSSFSLKTNEHIYFAGQITGVEGYVESAASGLIAGINAASKIFDKDKVIFPRETALGSLAFYISDDSIKNFQPMNINFGIMPKLEVKIRNKKEKNTMIAKKALEALARFQEKFFVSIV